MDFDADAFNYGDWKDAFFMKLFKPCMLYNEKATEKEKETGESISLNGTVLEYLDPDNYAKTIEGEDSHVKDKTCNANAMVEVGQIWIKEWVDSDGKIHVQIAPEQFEGADCYTHIKKDGTYRSVIYRSLFDGTNNSSVLMSISDQTACYSVTGTNQITYAKANGKGWGIDEYNFRRMLNYLLILISKTTDTQTAFGMGLCNSSILTSGKLIDKGMFYGSSTQTSAVKVFHIENWWGNIWKLTNGLLQSNGKLYYKMCEGTKDNSTVDDYQTASIEGYIDSGVSIPTGTITNQYIKEMALIPGLGLIPKVVTGGSSTTYYTDGLTSASVTPGVARFGGDRIDTTYCGCFCLLVSALISTTDATYGVALSYKEPDPVQEEEEEILQASAAV